MLWVGGAVLIFLLLLSALSQLILLEEFRDLETQTVRQDALHAKHMLFDELDVLAATAVAGYAMDGKGPRPGSRPLDGDGRMQVGPEDRCPGCGMKAIEHRKFASAIQVQDDTTYYFCGTGCMIRSWVHPEIFLGKTAADLKIPVVREYFTGRDTDARLLVFVAGSDIIGPMGPALVPVTDDKSLAVFQKRHGGQTVFLLEGMNDTRWFEITGKKMAR